MSLIDQIRQNASVLNKRIVLPESGDVRMIRAAAFLAENGICTPVLLGKVSVIQSLANEISITLASNVEIIEPALSDRLEMYSDHLYNRRKKKGLTEEAALELVKNELYFAAEMVIHGDADACVAGAVNTTGDVLRAAIQVIGLKPGSSVVSSVFLMSLPDGRVFTYGDCAVVPYPDKDQLASIAVDSSRTHAQLTGTEPKTAMLSFSSKGSAVHERTELVVEATAIAKSMAPELQIDGELQFDAAFMPEIGNKKAPQSAVAGKSNVFIFPNLDAGNIGYKITERIGGATATGPIIQGLAAPMNDLSRGCSWEDIVNTAAVSALQSN